MNEIVNLGVSIRVLFVGEKPMTIAVFKQLPVIDYENFEGEIIGFVRYVHNSRSIWFLCTMEAQLYKSPQKTLGANWLKMEWDKFNSYRHAITKSEEFVEVARLGRLQSIHDFEANVIKTKPQIFIAV